jgi:hypothetical protein
MNNSVKKYGILLILVSWLHFVANGQERQKPQMTIEELTTIAKKYGLENMVSQNKGLVYSDKKEVEQYFQNESKAQKSSAEFSLMMTKTKNVRTYKDYFNLLDASPLVKEQFLAAHSWNEEAYQKYVSSFAKYKWRIYRDEFGGISFYRADTKIAKEEPKQSLRIDRLPKLAKE